MRVPSDRPGPHPPPPADLAERALPLRTFRGPWFRMHAAGKDPVFFGRTGRNRFDAPAGEFGVLYVAADPECAFVETFGWDTGVRIVTAEALSLRHLAELRPSRAVKLADLTGAGLARLGADARLFAGDHGPARLWSLALYRHPQRPDGLYYPARHDPSRRAAALFDRDPARFAVRALGKLDAPEHRALLAQILDRYGFGYLP